MADQLFDNYGIGTGSPNLFGGGMSEQELNQLLGQFTPRPSIAEGLVVDGTADRVDRGGSFPYIPFEKEPEGLIRILNQNTGKYELKKDPNFIPYNSPEYWAMMQADADQVAANGISQTQLQTLSGGMKTDDPTFALDQTQLSAPTSVMGMFPEVEAMQRALYQQKQNEAMQAQAMQFARLTPFEKASYGLAMGSQQLGNAIGSAFGGKDPQLQMISLQSRILSELDPSDPAQQLRVARKYAQAAPELAMKIADNALSSQVKIAQINRERKAAIGVPLQVSDRINELNQKMRMLPPDSVEYQDAEEEKARLMKPEKPEPRPSVGTDREAFALTDFNKNYYDLTPDQREKVNVKADEKTAKDAAAKAPKVQVDLNDKTAVAKASLDVMSKWEGFLKSSGDVENAVRYKGVLSSVALANAGNPSADSSLLYNIAKIYDNSGAVQEGDKKTIIGNPNIPTRFQLLVQGVLEGGSFTPKQREDLKNIATELVKNKQSQLNAYRKQYVKKIKEFGGDEMDILDPYAGVIKPPLTDFVNK
jgi:hypothetical protein